MLKLEIELTDKTDKVEEDFEKNVEEILIPMARSVIKSSPCLSWQMSFRFKKKIERRRNIHFIITRMRARGWNDSRRILAQFVQKISQNSGHCQRKNTLQCKLFETEKLQLCYKAIKSRSEATHFKIECFTQKIVKIISMHRELMFSGTFRHFSPPNGTFLLAF